MYKTEMVMFCSTQTPEVSINKTLELLQKYYEIDNVTLAFRGTDAFITYKIVNYK